MDAQSILDALRLHHASVTLAWPDLTLQAPAGLPRHLYDALKAHKWAVIAALLVPDLTRAADRLWEYEQRGQMGTPAYVQLLARWINGLCAYEVADSRAQRGERAVAG